MKKTLLVLLVLVLVALIGFSVFQQLQIRSLTDRINTLSSVKAELDKNLVGDCFNENVLRQALGAPPINLEGCKSEREEWYNRLKELEEGAELGS